MKNLLILFSFICLSSCGETPVHEAKKDLNINNYKVNECLLNAYSAKGFYKIYFVGKYGLAFVKWNRETAVYENGNYSLYRDMSLDRSDCPDLMLYGVKNDK